MPIVRANNKSLQVSSLQPEDYWKWIEAGNYNREFAAYDRYLKPEQTFVDIGAWVGAHSLYASTKAARVIAVEPDPVAFAILENNLVGSDCHQLAIMDHEGTVKIGSGLLGASTTRVNPNAGANIGPWEDGQTAVANCTTLRKFVDSLEVPLFIKIDIEGAEERIFKDATLFKQRKPTVLVELHPWWWEKPEQAAKDFATVRGLYHNPITIFHNTWVLID